MKQAPVRADGMLPPRMPNQHMHAVMRPHTAWGLRQPLSLLQLLLLLLLLNVGVLLSLPLHHAVLLPEKAAHALDGAAVASGVETHAGRRWSGSSADALAALSMPASKAAYETSASDAHDSDSALPSAFPAEQSSVSWFMDRAPERSSEGQQLEHHAGHAFTALQRRAALGVIMGDGEDWNATDASAIDALSGSSPSAPTDPVRSLQPRHRSLLRMLEGQSLATSYSRMHATHHRRLRVMQRHGNHYCIAQNLRFYAIL